MAMLNWAAYLGHEAAVAAALMEMRAAGVTVDEALAGYESLMAERMAEMIPVEDARESGRRGDSRIAPAPRNAKTRRQAGQADMEHFLGPCPKCGGEVWGIRKCPHIAPPWQTFFACDNEDCGHHGRSRLTVEQLRRRWPDGAEVG